MSQHSLVISADELNGALAALGSTMKGPYTPPSVQAGLTWLDDSASPWVLKIYDGADWISIGTVNPTTNAFLASGIGEGAVSTAGLADGAVSTAKIADGAVSTGKIAANAVTFAKMQAIGTSRLLGRSTSGSGEVEEIAIGTGLTLSSGVLAASGGAAPTGAVMPYAGSTEPSGWLFCAGQAVSRSTYATLFTAIGTAYGSGDGSTTFNLPDLRGRVVAGRDDMGGSAANRLTSGGSGIAGTTLGASGGTQTHTLTIAEMPAHSHSLTLIHDGGSAASGAAEAIDTFGPTTSTANTGGGAAHQNTQPTLIANYIIKT